MFLGIINFAGTAVGAHLQPGMRMPIAATSLREFWARRWNLPTTAVLRAVMYAPLVGIPQRGQRKASLGLNGGPADSSTARAQRAARTVELPDAAAVQQRAGGALRQRPSAETTGQAEPGTSSSTENALNPRAPRKKTLSADGTSSSGSNSLEEVQERGSAARRVVALCTVFVVSGAIHQWIQHVMFDQPAGELRWACAFLLQPPLIAAQDALQRTRLWHAAFARSPSFKRCARTAQPNSVR